MIHVSQGMDVRCFYFLAVVIARNMYIDKPKSIATEYIIHVLAPLSSSLIPL